MAKTCDDMSGRLASRCAESERGKTRVAAMPRMRTDQAEGLRRLFERGRLRVVSVSAAAPATIVNLAGALAERGGDVLILDEHPAGEGAAAALGLKARHDLEDVIQRRRELDEVILRGPAGIRILPLARGARALAQLPAAEQQRLIERCGRLDAPLDTLLVDAAPASASALLWPDAAAQEVIVLAGANASAITAAYALIKRRAQEFARREFHVLVANVAGESEARAIYRNMASTARRYLQVKLDFLGYVPPDDKLQHAARLRLPVVAAFPQTAAAASFRALAQAIAGWPRAAEEGGGFDDFMRRLIHSNLPRAAAA